MTPHTIYFIRHGETDWNAAQRYQGQTDIPLNAKGREQATRNGIVLGQRLGTTASRLLYIASPLSRTSETMRLLRQSMGLPANEFQTDDRLKEQHFGHWEGQLWSELPRIDPEGFAARKADTWNWTPRGGENYEAVRVRVTAWLEEIRQDAVVVSHGNISRALRGITLGLSKTDIPRLEVPQDRVLVIHTGQAEWI
jgi:broad specificity phosphatase PhoE